MQLPVFYSCCQTQVPMPQYLCSQMVSHYDFFHLSLSLGNLLLYPQAHQLSEIVFSVAQLGDEKDWSDST